MCDQILRLYEKSFQKMRQASEQSHNGHWDSKMTSGANCPECIRANGLRKEADDIFGEAVRLRKKRILGGVVMDEEKEYTISDDIDLLMRKTNAAMKLRDLAIKLPFGYRKARKAATDFEQFKIAFWRKVLAVYPELKGKALRYDELSKKVIIKDSQPASADSASLRG